MKAPTTKASVLCRAIRPDGGVAFQKYNAKTKKWAWVFVGSAYFKGRTFREKDVLYQLKPHPRFGCNESRYKTGWYRFVLVRTWIKRVGGWRAVITKASPAVYWRKRK